MTFTPEEIEFVRKTAEDAFGSFLDLSASDKDKLRAALKDSVQLSLNEFRQAALKLETPCNVRAILKLRAEMLQERMGEMMRKSQGGKP